MIIRVLRYAEPTTDDKFTWAPAVYQDCACFCTAGEILRSAAGKSSINQSADSIVRILETICADVMANARPNSASDFQ